MFIWKHVGGMKAVEHSLCLIGCRNRSSHDPRHKPRHGHVLGNVTLEPHGDHGETVSKPIFTPSVDNQPRCLRLVDAASFFPPFLGGLLGGKTVQPDSSHL